MISNKMVVEMMQKMIDKKVENFKIDLTDVMEFVKEVLEEENAAQKAIEVTAPRDVIIPSAKESIFVETAPAIVAAAKVSAQMPIYKEVISETTEEIDAADYCEDFIAAFGRRYEATFEEFFLAMPFDRVLNRYMYYSCAGIIALYKAYTGCDIEAPSLTSAFEGKDYSADITLHTYKGKLVYSFRELKAMQDNIINNVYNVAEAEKVEEVVATEKPKRVLSHDLLNYLLTDVDINHVIEKNMSLDDLAQEFNNSSGSGKKITAHNIRNKFTYFGISGKSVTGSYTRINGQVVGTMLKLLRKKAAETENGYVAKLVKASGPSPEIVVPASGLTASIGDILKSKLIH